LSAAVPAKANSSSGTDVIRETLITAERRRPLVDLRELLDYRDLALLLARRDVAVRYRQTALGIAWAILQPLGMVLVLTLVLGRVARMPSDGVPYMLFLLTAWVPWHFFASGMNAAGTSIVGNPNLITKVYFPRLVIPAAALGAPAVDFAVACGLIVAVMAWHGTVPGAALALVPLAFLLAGLVAFGVGCFVAALTVTYRDFRHLMPFATMLWLWLTPVFYPLSAVPEPWRQLMVLNPMTGVVDAMRAAWLGTPLNVFALAVSLLVGALLLVGGVAYFRRVERQFADVV
jgi:lipopolysaccharide transport system permease protein